MKDHIEATRWERYRKVLSKFHKNSKRRPPSSSSRSCDETECLPIEYNATPTTKTQSPNSILVDIHENSQLVTPLSTPASSRLYSNTANFIRPNSANSWVRRKRHLKELKVKSILSKLTQEENGTENIRPTDNSSLSEDVIDARRVNVIMNKKLIKKDILIEEQMKMIEELVDQIEILSRSCSQCSTRESYSNDNNDKSAIPIEVQVIESRDNYSDNQSTSPTIRRSSTTSSRDPQYDMS